MNRSEALEIALASMVYNYTNYDAEKFVEAVKIVREMKFESLLREDLNRTLATESEQYEPNYSVDDIGHSTLIQDLDDDGEYL